MRSIKAGASKSLFFHVKEHVAHQKGFKKTEDNNGRPITKWSQLCKIYEHDKIMQAQELAIKQLRFEELILDIMRGK